MVAKVKSFFNSCKKSTLVQGLLLLGFSGILCKLIGVFYRVPLSNIVGSEGMGLYGLIFPIYSLLLVISSSSIPLAISKMIGEKLSNNDLPYIAKLKKIAMYFMFVICLLLSLVVAFFSKDLALLQGDINSALGLLIISPSILIVGFICVYRGVFQGFNNVKYTAFSQVIEQVVKLVLGLFFAYHLINYGVQYAVAGAILGVTISELFAFIYLLYKYKTSSYYLELNNKDKLCKIKSKTILLELIKNLLPITLSGIVIPVSLVIDSFLIVNLLVTDFFTINEAVIDYGLNTGIVNTVINVPIVIISSLSILILPIIAKANKLKNENDISVFIKKSVNLCFFIALPAMFLTLIFPMQILQILYPALPYNELETASKLLCISSSSILSLGIFYLTSAILQGLNKLYFPIINSLIFSVIRILLYVFLVKIYGIYGVAMASAILYFFMSIINLRYLIKDYKFLKFDINKIFIHTLIFVLVNFIIFAFLFEFIGVYAFLISTFLSGVIYMLCNSKYIMNDNNITI